MASTKNSAQIENADVDILKLIAVHNQIASDNFLSKQLKSLHSSHLISTFTDERLQTEVAAEVSAIRSFLKNGSTGPHFPEATGDGDCRIYADGVFDLIHSGHFNAFRQAKAMGDCLVVGINSDEEVRSMKGSLTIYSEEERAEIVQACKWVDEVIIGTPYAVTLDFLNSVNCHYAAHGDDLAVGVNGVDCYKEPRAANRLKIFKRTEGISSTTLVSRLLVATERLGSSFACPQPTTVHKFVENLRSRRVSGDALTSTKRLLGFIDPLKQPKPTDKRVYVDGSFDIFHVGHVRILRKAKEMGDYLIVGIYDDATIRNIKGPGFPVVNMLERAMNVLAMRDVDEVLIGAPWKITPYLIKSFGVDIVIRGTVVDAISATDSIEELDDPYLIPKKMNIYHEILSSSTITTFQIIGRIIENRICLLSTLENRCCKEENYWNEKENERLLIH